MDKGCFGSALTASEKSEVCARCGDRPRCHDEARKNIESMFGKFAGFPVDSIKNKKKTKKEST
ncbi:TPA: hypothetical protein JD861_20105 [Klebsiella oxytoca]|jgi:hypothetical protein|nr:hypothetical protein AGH21_00285 [Klebsiella oxytoca]MTF12908.1 hypothetical protein [Raoultella ornithinolytica]UVY41784.1 MAG: hypothetical protein [Bacteriophage sp.]OWY88127.1 hypothetical protein CAC00_09500 [Raoultella ornithinolytica]HAU6254632.1 hypothetical protein [Klebsiella oxytoca]